jgi:hypothetical protein
MNEIQPANPVASLAEGLLRIAADPSVDPARIRELYAIHREMQADQAKAAFAASLRAMQAEMPRVKKNGVISLGAGKGAIPFARWEDIDAIVRPIMRSHGFSVTFSETAVSETGIRWTATWYHEAGHSEQNSISLPPDGGPGRNAVQARGSTNSYAKRYLAEDFLNIVREGADDDGKAGGTKYITEAQADELRMLLTATGRQEGAMLDKFFAGSVRSVDEIEVGQGYVGFKSTLEQLRNAAQKKAT